MTIEAAQLPEAARDPQEQVQPEQRIVTVLASDRDDRPLQLLLEIRGRSAGGDVGRQVVGELGIRARDARGAAGRFGLRIRPDPFSRTATFRCTRASCACHAETPAPATIAASVAAVAAAAIRLRATNFFRR